MTYRLCNQMLLLALVAALLLPGRAAAAFAASSIRAVVRAGGAELRETPNGKVIQTLPAATALEAHARSADSSWLRVTSLRGAAGWAATARLVVFSVASLPTEDAPSIAANRTPASAGASSTVTGTLPEGRKPITGAVDAGSQALNVRAGPGLGYPIITVREPGARVDLIGRNAAGDWLQIALADGGYGWVAAGLVRSAASTTELPAVLTPPAAAVAAAPPTGLTGKLVFQSSSGGTIYLFDFASAALRPLTIGADPAISPDGKAVAFWRQDSGQHGLYLIDLASGAVRQLFARPEKLRSPTWSPDGQQIAFSHVTGQDICRDAGYGMCLPDIFPYNRMFPAVYTDKWGLAATARDGGAYRDIPAMVGATGAHWGTGGLVYAAAGIYVTADQGGTDANRKLLPDLKFRDPSWQPGGDRIVFQSLEKDHWEIFSSTGGGAAPVALTRPATTLVPKLPWNVAPVWSPDGRAIAFLSDRSGSWAIWVMDESGANPRKLPITAPIEYSNSGEQVMSWGK